MAKYVSIASMMGVLLVLEGCAASKPSVASGKVRIEVRHTMSVGGQLPTSANSPAYRTALVTQIEDAKGKLVYHYKDRSSFQWSVDLPAGAYTITHTCYSGVVDYEKDSRNWNRYMWSLKVKTTAGDLYHLRANPHRQNNMKLQRGRQFDCMGLFGKE